LNRTDESQRIFERFSLIVNGPALFNALVAALEFDLFRFLSRQPGASVADLQAFTGIPAHQLRVLLHAVCATELIDRRDGGYTNSAVAEELLVPDGPAGWRHILRGWQKIYYPAFAGLTTAMRAGTNTALAAYPGTEPTLYQRISHAPELEEVLHASMGAFTLQTLDGLLDSPALGPVRHLLDIGGGDGTTAFGVARRYPAARVTIFDLPSVVELARQSAPAEVAGRIGWHPGDLFDDDFPTGADGVLFSHVLEVFPAESIQTLLGKAFDVLPAGGKAFIYGFDSGDERRGVYSARLSLYLNVLATGGGMAYPANDYEEWLRKAGFGTVEKFTDLPYEHGLVVGTKE
jgi:ubiquinone/menaquinone biosynthesis C-methylase UbiE